MKLGYNKLAITLFLGFVLFGSCQSTGKKNAETGEPVFAQAMSLDQGIQSAVQTIERNILQGTKIAVINFKSANDNFSEYVIEELAAHLVNNRKLIVVDRRNIDLIREEMKLQLSGDVSDDSAQRIGAMLGAQVIVSGSVASIGSNYQFRLTAINVETAVQESAVSLTVNGRDEKIVFLLTGELNRAAAQTAPPQTAAAQTPVQPSAIISGPVPDGLEYNIAFGQVTITRYTGRDETVIIPALIEGLPVRSMGRSAFSVTGNQRSRIKKVSLPPSLIIIEDNVFFRCSTLEEINIPDAVTFIGENAFYGCGNLQIVILPPALVTIGDYAFSGCVGLKSIILPPPLTTIGKGAFMACDFNEVNIPPLVTAIPDMAFSSCKNLERVTIPSSVTAIGERAFAYCNNLASIVIPPSVTTLGVSVFTGCDNLTSITLSRRTRGYFTGDERRLIYRD
ncbi:MAG: leucine-rich repeat protein [Treponema sp.]|nr:leucine-rich repeat protein [Treponema sp.]